MISYKSLRKKQIQSFCVNSIVLPFHKILTTKSLPILICYYLSLACSLPLSFLCEPGLKPGSHRKIAKDYRPKRGKDHDILRESV